MSNPVTGVIAGAGTLPVTIVQALRSQHKRVLVLSLLPEAKRQPELAMDGVECVSISIGSVGKALSLLRAGNVKDLLLAGAVKKPGFLSLVPDAGGIKLLSRLKALRQSGDDHVLKTVMRFFEEEGFRVLRTEDVIPDILLPAGALTAICPNTDALRSASLAARALQALAPFDMGQAAVVQHGCIIGIEGAEGTDALITRCATLTEEPSGLILVKIAKPKQDRRADLPSLGVNTIERLAKHGYAGIVAQAGSALLLEKGAMLALADQHGLFVYGGQWSDD